jgi:predicted TIM-barrel fold metal-dependent hydrolase
MFNETSSSVRAKLNYPIIDSDGHWREFPPVLMEFLRKAGGEKAVEGFKTIGAGINRVAVGLNGAHNPDGIPARIAERRQRRSSIGGWWLSPWGTLDRATGVLPRLMYERLDEIGLDFVVLFPSYGLSLPGIADDEARRATCRAYNIYLAEEYNRFSDRITPVAPIPMNTPDEAIAELEHAVGELGLKAIVMASLIPRPIKNPSPDAGSRIWLDALGLDSEYDYDPVWAKCLELGVSPSFHTLGREIALRSSPSNFVYNHIGHFAASGEAVCKALFLGGVTRRFPKLRFAFMEGGTGWACNLYADLVSHWEKRGPKGMEGLRPSNLDREQFVSLARRYGGPAWAEYLEKSGDQFEGLLLTIGINVPEELDDYAACGIKRAEDIRDLFAAKFYFGCEPDDPTVAWAFNTRTNPHGARINAIFSSDISHWDVPDMRGVLPEAYELVEHGLINEDNFRDFVFANAARFLTSANPGFFKGTVVEKQVQELIASSPAEQATAT